MKIWLRISGTHHPSVPWTERFLKQKLSVLKSGQFWESHYSWSLYVDSIISFILKVAYRKWGSGEKTVSKIWNKKAIKKIFI